MPSIHTARILLVEDDALQRSVLRETLKQSGFHCIDEACDGKEALDAISHYAPDLVILDVLMPEMDGVACCKAIRAHANPEVANVPVLVQTALEGINDKRRMFEAGATDYVTKPLDPHELLARVNVQLEREASVRALREYNQRVAEELEVARQAQELLNPSLAAIASLSHTYGIDIEQHSRACSELGGDFWGLHALSPHQLALYIVDFSGHGVSAALNVFRLHALMQKMFDEGTSAGAVLTHLNATLAALLPLGHYATMWYGVIDIRANTLAYASAASPPPVLLDAKGRPQLLAETGGLLGAFAHATFDTVTVPFSAGNRLLLYSDALIETHDETGRLREVEAWMVPFAQGGLTYVHDQFYAHCGTQLSDDLTLVSLKRDAK